MPRRSIWAFRQPLMWTESVPLDQMHGCNSIQPQPIRPTSAMSLPSTSSEPDTYLSRALSSLSEFYVVTGTLFITPGKPLKPSPKQPISKQSAHQFSTPAKNSRVYVWEPAWGDMSSLQFTLHSRIRCVHPYNDGRYLIITWGFSTKEILKRRVRTPSEN